MSAGRHPALLTGLLAGLVACAAPAARADETRLVLGLGVLPQFEQYLGDRALPAELYRAEVILPAGRRLGLGVELGARGDFVIVGGSAHVDFWQTERNEWQVLAGLGYALPLADSEDIFRSYTGEGSTSMDRMHVRVGVGQTFDIRAGGAALRVEYDARLMMRGSLLSVLEGLDDGVDTENTFLVHELVAGLELRWGRRP